MDYSQLLPYAHTESQRRAINALIEHGTQRAAAASLGIKPQSVQDAIAIVKKRAVSQGYSPDHDMTHTVPEPQVLKGVSTLYKNGEVLLQWVKTDQDKQKSLELYKEIVQSLTEDVPRLAPVPEPIHTQDQLCNLYVMTDCHVGMLAWGRETGADWDLHIAERVLTGCFEQMVKSSPDADTAVIAQLGDWLHSDGLLPLTPTNKNILDQDGRFPKLVAVAIRILRSLVSMALAKHRHVTFLTAEGNHDQASSVWMQAMFSALYENEPRVTVVKDPRPYYCYQHGQTMLAFHHGHLSRPPELPLIFASMFSDAWGQTAKRYCHTGHQHHIAIKEYPGMTVVQHPTLAAPDAYAARNGYISERQASCVTYHKKYGQVAQTIVTPEMLE